MDRRDAPEPASGVFKNTSERAAYELVPQFLAEGVLAEPYDRCGRQGAIDFLLHYRDGRTGAHEVTSYPASDSSMRICVRGTAYCHTSVSGRGTQGWEVHVTSWSSRNG
jgi:hypothetical protein